MEQLGNLDSLFVSLETSGAPQHVGCFGIYAPASGGIVRFGDVLAHIEQRLTQFPNFRRRLMQMPGRIDRPYWVTDDSFDIEFHVRHLSLPKPGDWRQLCIQIARLHARSLDLTRSLWQCYLIEGLEYFPDCPDGSFALYVKIHHSLLEGDFGQRFVDALHDSELLTAISAPVPEAADIVAEVRWSDSGLPPVWEGAQGVGKSFVQRIRRVLPLARTMASTAWDLSDTLWRIYREELPAPQLGPSCRFDHPLGQRRVVEATLFSRADFEVISAAEQVSIHDVAVAVIGGAMRCYLEHHDELPVQSIVAYMPIGIASEGDSSRGQMAVSTLMARVHSDIDDPIERLHSVHQSMDSAKCLLDTPLVDPLRMVGIVPPFMTRLMAHFYLDERMGALRPAGTVIANMDGIDGEQYCMGARLVQRYWLGALSPAVGLFHTLYSLNGKISVTVLADRTAMPDPTFYRECLEDAFFELRDAAFAAQQR
jgi:diacylglycerol O-acyltransferase